MRIAIIGAGFCGCATAWHCLQKFPQADLTLFDPHGIGGGVSGIAAGLLHPFCGAHSKLNYMGWEGMQASRELLELSSRTLKKPVFSDAGIVRPALSDEQKSDFHICVNRYPEEAFWFHEEACLSLFPGIVRSPALYIQCGISVECKLYLEGLWTACQNKGAKFQQDKIINLSELANYDLKIIAAGGDINKIIEPYQLPLKFVKGQLLEIEWPKSNPPLKYPLNSQAYLVMNRSGASCYAGSSFEKNFTASTPELAVAKNEILPKLTAMLPHIAAMPIIGCQAGLRVVAPRHLPLVQMIAPQTWVITGMGSKGLLHHALMAKQLVEQVMSKL